MRDEFLISQNMNLENIQYISELAMQMKLNILLYIIPFKPGDSGFNVEGFYILPTQCVCVFCMDIRTNSNY